MKQCNASNIKHNNTRYNVCDNTMHDNIIDNIWNNASKIKHNNTRDNVCDNTMQDNIIDYIIWNNTMHNNTNDNIWDCTIEDKILQYDKKYINLYIA